MFILIEVWLKNILVQGNNSFFQLAGLIFLVCITIICVFLTVVLLIKLKKNQKDLKLKLQHISKLEEANLQLDKEIEIHKDLGFQNTELRELSQLQRDELAVLKSEFSELKNHLQEQVLLKTSELHTSLETTKESNRLKDAFLEKISREIRTPLNAILGFINLLNDPNISKIDRENYLKLIRDSGNNLLNLIDNIVDFTRLETGEFLIDFKRCNLNILVADLVDKYRSRFFREKPKVAIIYNKPELLSESLADCKRILHIMDQLISNAIKYTEKGKVEINYSIADGFHVFTVSDTGIGIEKKYHDIIFERFYQIETKTHDVFKGAGLGLTIAKRMADILEGSLSIQSKIGQGSVFTLKIPYKEVKGKKQSNLYKEQNLNWQNKTILIAEDEDSNFHFLDAVLKRTNAKILRAVDGVKFLEIMNENKNIDLVLLDIKMPGINGFNAIKVVRQQNINIPVIAQTAFNQPEDKQRCLDSGCDDYLAKPIDKELLIAKISHYFSQRNS